MSMDGSGATGIDVFALVSLLAFLAVVVLVVAGVFLVLKGRPYGWIGIALGIPLGLIPQLWLVCGILETLTAREYWGPLPSRVLEPVGSEGGRLRVIACVGDLDGDGCEDIAALVSDSVESSTRHEMVAFSGRNGERVLHEAFETASANSWFAIGGAGDVDGDAVPDLVLGTRDPRWTGDDPLREIQVRSGRDGSLIGGWTQPLADEGVELTLAGAGDVDGDRFGDILVGSDLPSGSGIVRLHSGRDGSLLDSLEGDSKEERFGSAMRALGDVDADGHGDFAVGSSGWDRPGVVQAFSGRERREIWRVAGPTADSSIGVLLEPVDDRDGDGIRDLLIGGRYASLIVSARAGTVLQVFEDASVIALLDDRDGDGRSETLQLAWGGESKFFDHPIYSRLEVIGSRSAALLTELSFPGPPIFGAPGWVAAFGEGSDSFAVMRGDRILQFADASVPVR